MNVDVAIADQPRLRNGFSTVAVHVPILGAHEVLDLDLDALFPEVAPPDPIALDLLLLAGIVYVLDKAAPRRVAEDAWTRAFSVEFPVSDPDRWEPATRDLEDALAYLTGDEWTIAFGRRPDGLFVPPRQRRVPRSVPAVSAVGLFSGGLDSLVGAIDRLATDTERLLLVGHYDDAGPSGAQRRLHEMLDELAPYRGRTDRLAVRVRPLPPGAARPGQRVAPAGRERTLRSRSLVFLALGLYAAALVGVGTPLHVPENGFIAINIPLTPSRIGTSSTRTTHPYFLEKIRRVAQTVGLQHPIRNPLEEKTKGEVLAECTDRDTLRRLAPESVSCAHPSRRGRWRRRDARNCGYCVPCIIRRAALHRVGQDRGRDYGFDVCAGELGLDVDIADDLRAVLDCLRHVQTPEAIHDRVVVTGPLDPEERRRFSPMVGRGLGELRDLVATKGSAELRERAGIA
jgi:hypothetical protein